MLDTLTTTQMMASLVGLYFAAAGIGLLTDRNELAELYKGINEQPLVGYLCGVLAFVVGGAMVAVHNDWSSISAGFVSLIGWIALAEGVLMLACRKWFIGLIEQMTFSPRFISLMGAATLVAGVALLWAGLGG